MNVYTCSHELIASGRFEDALIEDADILVRDEQDRVVVFYIWVLRCVEGDVVIRPTRWYRTSDGKFSESMVIDGRPDGLRHHNFDAPIPTEGCHAYRREAYREHK
jgi:hypothetical protein